MLSASFTVLKEKEEEEQHAQDTDIAGTYNWEFSQVCNMSLIRGHNLSWNVLHAYQL
jgi:hypothetical protein